jgi:hypothetical protein
VKVAAAAAAARIIFNFSLSTLCREDARCCAGNSHALFPEGLLLVPDAVTVPAPQANEVVVFKDLFLVGLHMPPHPVLAEILQKFRVHLH